MDFITNNLLTIVGGSSTAVALWLLKRIPNEDIYSWVETGSYWLGTVVTLGAAKWKYTKKLWNATIEPYFVDLIENTVGAAVNGFIKGLKSDN
tara:strand:+ start:1171 stop:1449 length:279 start_codon:yes stop_codon:yes gene_type:complete